MPAVPAVSPASAYVRPAAGSWLQTACTLVQTHGSPGLTWPAAVQTAALPALFGCQPKLLAGTAREPRCAARWSQAHSASVEACMGTNRICYVCVTPNEGRL